MVICLVWLVWLGVGYSDSPLFGLYSIVCGEGFALCCGCGWFWCFVGVWLWVWFWINRRVEWLSDFIVSGFLSFLSFLFWVDCGWVWVCLTGCLGLLLLRGFVFLILWFWSLLLGGWSCSWVCFAAAFVVCYYFAGYSELVVRFNSVVDGVLVDLIYVDFGVLYCFCLCSCAVRCLGWYWFG